MNISLQPINNSRIAFGEHEYDGVNPELVWDTRDYSKQNNTKNDKQVVADSQKEMQNNINSISKSSELHTFAMHQVKINEALQNQINELNRKINS